ncbi:MAG: B12-binding domain-containing radical SAM protein [Nitrospirae bacterium]|nr:B12-binding domain-containing radical SAM protein [Nitrospirota bacterium]
MKKNKIILVNPGTHFQEIMSYGAYPNTAIMVLATILHNAGFQVIVVDGRYQRIDEAVNSILKEIDERVIFVGFSVMTVQLPWAYHVSQAIKQRHSNAVIVWGGVHPTLFPEQTVEDKAVDIVVVNDAAATIIPLSLTLSEGGDLSGVPGVYYKTAKHSIVQTPPNPVKDDLSNIPALDFSLIDHLRYSRNNVIAVEDFYGDAYKNCLVYPIITGIGCSYKCTFCINVILQKSYRFKKAGEIIEEIKKLIKNYRADFIQPLDENFFINKKRIFEFVELLEQENINIKWRPQLRADYFSDTYINVELAKRLEKSGMVVAAMGVESASQQILDMLKKQLKVENIIKAMEILSKTNIVPKMNFMVGLPGETEDEIKKTYSLAVKLRGMVKKSCITVSPFRPYPGSPLYEQVVSEYGYSPPTNLSDWAMLSKKEFMEGVGYESFEKYKWIQNSGKLKAMQYVYNRIAWNRPKRDSKFYWRIIRFVSFMRFNFDFFEFVSFERAVLERLLKIKEFTTAFFSKNVLSADR